MANSELSNINNLHCVNKKNFTTLHTTLKPSQQELKKPRIRSIKVICNETGNTQNFFLV